MIAVRTHEEGTSMALLTDDADIKQLLKDAQTIAVVGHSNKPDRTSYQIAQIMKDHGYTIYPVNPTVDTIDGEPAYSSLKDIPAEIDIVQVFRRSEYLAEIVDEALAAGAGSVWAQSGIKSDDAAAKADQIDLVMDRCMKVEYARLMDA
jgi:hypothetical protein